MNSAFVSNAHMKDVRHRTQHRSLHSVITDVRHARRFHAAYQFATCELRRCLKRGRHVPAFIIVVPLTCELIAPSQRSLLLCLRRHTRKLSRPSQTHGLPTRATACCGKCSPPSQNMYDIVSQKHHGPFGYGLIWATSARHWSAAVRRSLRRIVPHCHARATP